MMVYQSRFFVEAKKFALSIEEGRLVLCIMERSKDASCTVHLGKVSVSAVMFIKERG